MVEESPQNGKEPEKKSGFFGSHAKKDDSPEKIKALADGITTVNRRVRLIEEHMSSLRRKVQVNEQNVLSDNKKNSSEFRTVNSEIIELRSMINDIDNKLLLIIKELKLCAKKEEVSVLQKYIDMWEPIKFVTKSEVEKIIEDILQDKGL